MGLQNKWSRTSSPGRVLPYLGMVGRFRSDDSRFFLMIFDQNGSLSFASSWTDWPSFSVEICLSLSHLVPKIRWSTFGLICHQNILFLGILYQFSPWFSIQLTSFFIDHKISLTPHFHKTLDLKESNFFYNVLNPVTENLVKYLPPHIILWFNIPVTANNNMTGSDCSISSVCMLVKTC